MLVGDDQVAQRVSGCQLDKKCVYLGHEIAFSEVGLLDEDENETKELHEQGLKAPKMLKDFFSSLTNAFPRAVHKSKTAAFIISGKRQLCYIKMNKFKPCSLNKNTSHLLGFHITVIVMDSPDGSVCRLTYSERVEFPTDLALCIKQLVPIMELVYHVRLYLLETIDAIERG